VEEHHDGLASGDCSVGEGDAFPLHRRSVYDKTGVPDSGYAKAA
jgi:hypothetical protein